MRLAWRELRRKPSRFAVATVILFLLSVLLMFLGGLLDGLIGNATGAYSAQRADLIVYSSTAQDALERSRIEPDVRTQVADTLGDDARVGGLASVTLGGRLDGRGPRDLVSTVLWGYELAPKGLPDTPPPPGQVYADESLAAEGVAVGTTIRLGPDQTPLRVLGFVDRRESSSNGALWGSLDTWRDTVADNLPGQRVGDDVVQALVIQSTEGVLLDETASRIDDATSGATRTLTIDQAIEAIPGVSAQRSTFNQILGVTVGIAIVVVALFFALLTVERTGLYGVLKALGARSRTLFAGVVLQALVVTLIDSAVGVAATLAFAALIPPGTIPFQVGPARLVGSVAVLLVAAVIGCAFSLRRVLRIDPAAAIGGAT
ncbi:MAG: ABC transporter permease [Propionibacteriaceae bacterium]